MQISFLACLEKILNDEQRRKYAQETLKKQKLRLWQSAVSETDWYIRTMLKHKLTTLLKKFGPNTQKLVVS